MNPVARAGDVAATASSATNYPNDASPTATGAWTAGQVSETTVGIAGSDGARVVRQASCVFTFAGSNTQSGAPVSSTSTVTLNPSPRLLKVDGRDPLVAGDEAQDLYGNTLRVTSSASWRTD